MILVHYLLLNAGDCVLSVISRFSELVNTFSHFFITVKTNADACSETSCSRLKKRLKLTHSCQRLCEPSPYYVANRPVGPTASRLSVELCLWA